MSGIIGGAGSKSGVVGNTQLKYASGRHVFTDSMSFYSDSHSDYGQVTIRRADDLTKMRLLSNTSTTNSDLRWIEFMNQDGGGSMGFIGGSGSYNAAFGAWSDERLKKDITNLTDQLALIRQLKPRNFKFKVNDEAAVGFIAQEIQKVFPEAVVESTLPEDGKKALTLNGWSKTDCRIVKAIQELADENDSLKTENTALKSRMDALEARITALEG